MIIYLNGEEKSVPQNGLTVLELLSQVGVNSPETVSVQVNGQFVEKDVYGHTILKDGDEVDFLYFMGGGLTYEGF